MRKICFTFLLIVLFSLPSYCQSDVEKANMILKFAENLEWVKNGPASGEPIMIGIIDEASISSVLKEKASTSKRKITVLTKAITDDFNGCHVIFTPAQELKSLAKVLKKVSKTNIVTISNAKDFARYGIMINIVKKSSFEVNKMVLDGAGVKLSDSLMKKAIKI